MIPTNMQRNECPCVNHLGNTHDIIVCSLLHQENNSKVILYTNSHSVTQDISLNFPLARRVKQ